jgi:hypothetical protein
MKKSDICVLILTAFFALQALYLTEIYNINYPYAYDMTSLYIFLDYFETDDHSFTKFIERLLTDTNSRAIVFPKLVVTPNYLLNNFDSGNIFYMNWIILILTLVVIFLILRNHNKELYWTLIPISAFIFSPLINNNYWNYTILIWYLPALCIVTIIYFLSRKQNLKNTVMVLLFSSIATYSIPLGLTAWIIGSTTILKRSFHRNITDWKIPIIYFSSMLAIGTIYYSGNIAAQKIIPISQFLTVKTVFVVATFIAVPFKLKYDILMISVGLISILLSISLSYYLGIRKKKINEIFPWVLFLVIGFSGAIIMRIGRFADYFEGNLPYYSPIAELFQIGITVLTASMILEIRKDNFKRKKFILFILYSIIILQMILLIPSYYNGWWKADYYYNEKLEHISCFSLYYNGYDCDTYYIKSFDKVDDVTWYNTFVILNYFIKNHSNLFSDPNFNKETIDELKKFGENINQSTVRKIEGEISTINNVKEIKEYSIRDDQSLFITGHIIDENANDISAIYLMMDGRPVTKFDNFDHSEYTIDNIKKGKIEWRFGILKSYLESGCKTVTIAGTIDNEIFILNDTVKVCLD